MPKCMRCKDGSWECGFRPCAGGAGVPWDLMGRSWIPIGGAEVAIDVYSRMVDHVDEDTGEVKGKVCEVKLVPCIRTDCNCQDDDHDHNHHHHYPWHLHLRPQLLAETDSP